MLGQKRPEAGNVETGRKNKGSLLDEFTLQRLERENVLR